MAGQGQGQAQCSPQLYAVKVKGGGRFLYDTIDVGRFALKMAEVGDTRPFTVKPQPWWRQIGYRIESWWISRG